MIQDIQMRNSKFLVESHLKLHQKSIKQSWENFAREIQRNLTMQMNKCVWWHNNNHAHPRTYTKQTKYQYFYSDLHVKAHAHMYILPYLRHFKQFGSRAHPLYTVRIHCRQKVSELSYTVRKMASEFQLISIQTIEMKFWVLATLCTIKYDVSSALARQFGINFLAV